MGGLHQVHIITRRSLCLVQHRAREHHIHVRAHCLAHLEHRLRANRAGAGCACRKTKSRFQNTGEARSSTAYLQHRARRHDYSCAQRS